MTDIISIAEEDLDAIRRALLNASRVVDYLASGFFEAEDALQPVLEELGRCIALFEQPEGNGEGEG